MSSKRGRKPTRDPEKTPRNDSPAANDCPSSNGKKTLFTQCRRVGLHKKRTGETPSPISTVPEAAPTEVSPSTTRSGSRSSTPALTPITRSRSETPRGRPATLGLRRSGSQPTKRKLDETRGNNNNAISKKSVEGSVVNSNDSVTVSDDLVVGTSALVLNTDCNRMDNAVVKGRKLQIVDIFKKRSNTDLYDSYDLLTNDLLINSDSVKNNVANNKANHINNNVASEKPSKTGNAPVKSNGQFSPEKIKKPPDIKNKSKLSDKNGLKNDNKPNKNAPKNNKNDSKSDKNNGKTPESSDEQKTVVVKIPEKKTDKITKSDKKPPNKSETLTSPKNLMIIDVKHEKRKTRSKSDNNKEDDASVDSDDPKNPNKRKNNDSDDTESKHPMTKQKKHNNSKPDDKNSEKFNNTEEKFKNTDENPSGKPKIQLKRLDKLIQISSNPSSPIAPKGTEDEQSDKKISEKNPQSDLEIKNLSTSNKSDNNIQNISDTPDKIVTRSSNLDENNLMVTDGVKSEDLKIKSDSDSEKMSLDKLEIKTNNNLNPNVVEKSDTESKSELDSISGKEIMASIQLSEASDKPNYESDVISNIYPKNQKPNISPETIPIKKRKLRDRIEAIVPSDVAPSQYPEEDVNNSSLNNSTNEPLMENQVINDTEDNERNIKRGTRGRGRGRRSKSRPRKNNNRENSESAEFKVLEILAQPKLTVAQKLSSELMAQNVLEEEPNSPEPQEVVVETTKKTRGRKPAVNKIDARKSRARYNNESNDSEDLSNFPIRYSRTRGLDGKRSRKSTRITDIECAQEAQKEMEKSTSKESNEPEEIPAENIIIESVAQNLEARMDNTDIENSSQDNYEYDNNKMAKGTVTFCDCANGQHLKCKTLNGKCSKLISSNEVAQNSPKPSTSKANLLNELSESPNKKSRRKQMFCYSEYLFSDDSLDDADKKKNKLDKRKRMNKMEPLYLYEYNNKKRKVLEQKSDNSEKIILNIASLKQKLKEKISETSNEGFNDMDDIPLSERLTRDKNDIISPQSFQVSNHNISRRSRRTSCVNYREESDSDDEIMAFIDGNPITQPNYEEFSSQANTSFGNIFGLENKKKNPESEYEFTEDKPENITLVDLRLQKKRRSYTDLTDRNGEKESEPIPSFTDNNKTLKQYSKKSYNRKHYKNGNNKDMQTYSSEFNAPNNNIDIQIGENQTYDENVIETQAEIVEEEVISQYNVVKIIPETSNFHPEIFFENVTQIQEITPIDQEQLIEQAEVVIQTTDNTSTVDQEIILITEENPEQLVIYNLPTENIESDKTEAIQTAPLNTEPLIIEENIESDPPKVVEEPEKNLFVVKPIADIVPKPPPIPEKTPPRFSPITKRSNFDSVRPKSIHTPVKKKECLDIDKIIEQVKMKKRIDTEQSESPPTPTIAETSPKLIIHDFITTPTRKTRSEIINRVSERHMQESRITPKSNTLDIDRIIKEIQREKEIKAEQDRLREKLKLEESKVSETSNDDLDKSLINTPDSQDLDLKHKTHQKDVEKIESVSNKPISESKIVPISDNRPVMDKNIKPENNKQPIIFNNHVEKSILDNKSDKSVYINNKKIDISLAEDQFGIRRRKGVLESQLRSIDSDNNKVTEEGSSFIRRKSRRKQILEDKIDSKLEIHESENRVSQNMDISDVSSDKNNLDNLFSDIESKEKLVGENKLVSESDQEKSGRKSDEKAPNNNKITENSKSIGLDISLRKTIEKIRAAINEEKSGKKIGANVEEEKPVKRVNVEVNEEKTVAEEKPVKKIAAEISEEKPVNEKSVVNKTEVSTPKEKLQPKPEVFNFQKEKPVKKTDVEKGKPVNNKLFQGHIINERIFETFVTKEKSVRKNQEEKSVMEKPETDSLNDDKPVNECETPVKEHETETSNEKSVKENQENEEKSDISKKKFIFEMKTRNRRVKPVSKTPTDSPDPEKPVKSKEKSVLIEITLASDKNEENPQQLVDEISQSEENQFEKLAKYRKRDTTDTNNVETDKTDEKINNKKSDDEEQTEKPRSNDDLLPLLLPKLELIPINQLNVGKSDEKTVVKSHYNMRKLKNKHTRMSRSKSVTKFENSLNDSLAAEDITIRNDTIIHRMEKKSSGMDRKAVASRRNRGRPRKKDDEFDKFLEESIKKNGFRGYTVNEIKETYKSLEKGKTQKEPIEDIDEEKRKMIEYAKNCHVVLIRHDYQFYESKSKLQKRQQRKSRRRRRLTRTYKPRSTRSRSASSLLLPQPDTTKTTGSLSEVEEMDTNDDDEYETEDDDLLQMPEITMESLTEIIGSAPLKSKTVVERRQRPMYFSDSEDDDTVTETLNDTPKDYEEIELIKALRSIKKSEYNKKPFITLGKNAEVTNNHVSIDNVDSVKRPLIAFTNVYDMNCNSHYRATIQRTQNDNNASFLKKQPIVSSLTPETTAIPIQMRIGRQPDDERLFNHTENFELTPESNVMVVHKDNVIEYMKAHDNTVRRTRDIVHPSTSYDDNKSMILEHNKYMNNGQILSIFDPLLTDLQSYMDQQNRVEIPKTVEDRVEFYKRYVKEIHETEARLAGKLEIIKKLRTINFVSLTLREKAKVNLQLKKICQTALLELGGLVTQTSVKPFNMETLLHNLNISLDVVGYNKERDEFI